jgi:protein-S-isoprenylcysteine O-methyltransferase Ste14
VTSRRIAVSFLSESRRALPELVDPLRGIGFRESVIEFLTRFPAQCLKVRSLRIRHQLVTAGPYRWIRHPLYTTAIVLFLALGLMQASLLVLVVTVAAALLMRSLVIPAEERELAAKFGDRYRVYMTRAGRFLPRR